MEHVVLARTPHDLDVECAEGARLRPTVRVVLIDPAGRLLLMRVRAFDGGAPVWFLPGGGIEAGETDLEAAVREVAEETGLLDCPIRPSEVWRRRLVAEIEGVRYDFRERYYVAYVDAFEPSPAQLTSYEQRTLLEIRWWSLPDLAASAERFVPERPAALFAPLFATPIPCLFPTAAVDI